MSGGAIAMAVTILITVGITAYLVGTMARSIQNEKKTSLRLWKNFGLSLGFCALFFMSWIGQGIAQWQKFTDEQRQHKEPVEVGDFTSDFLQSTMENWQSEFLQLFSFTVMASVLIHKGSAESRDGGDSVQAALKRIEDKLGTSPTLRAEPLRKGDHLHVVPDDYQGWSLVDEKSTEALGYYDTQEEAIAAGRELATKNSVKLFIHGEDGLVREQMG
jgi:hypothetical protein